MSHFVVAVFSHEPDQVDELLAPYIEQVDPDSSFAEFVEDDEHDLDETTGKRGFWHNPNARWDWYTVGGRWRGLLKLLEGKTGRYGNEYTEEERKELKDDHCDSALVNDCDFSASEEAWQNAVRVWEIIVEGRERTEEEKGQFLGIYTAQYYLDQYGTKENYARQQSMFLPFAFVTADGEWNETGRMGWWAMSDATADSRESFVSAFQAYLEEARKQNLTITMVDCHI